MIVRFAAMVVVALLSACTVIPERPPVADPQASWEVHRARLSALEQWRLSGSLAVEAQGEGGQGRVEWRQSGENYDIRLSGPLGQGAAKLTGNGEQATLALGDGTRYTDQSPSLVLYEHLGWWVPVAALRWWAVGLPSPDAPASWRLDAQGRLAQLDQVGWQVQFESYTREGDLDLPQRVVIAGDGASVRLFARRWHWSANAKAGAP